MGNFTNKELQSLIAKALANTPTVTAYIFLYQQKAILTGCCATQLPVNAVN
jgi:hypothetical protein